MLWNVFILKKQFCRGEIFASQYLWSTTTSSQKKDLNPLIIDGFADGRVENNHHYSSFIIHYHHWSQNLYLWKVKTCIYYINYKLVVLFNKKGDLFSYKVVNYLSFPIKLHSKLPLCRSDLIGERVLSLKPL